ncbi:MAG: hypothetical protein JSU64_03385, partial [candidate division WOR-3 bacterium]
MKLEWSKTQGVADQIGRVSAKEDQQRLVSATKRVDIHLFLITIWHMNRRKILFFLSVSILGCATFGPRPAADIPTERAEENAAIIFERGNDLFKRKDYENALLAFEQIVSRYAATDAYEPAMYLTAFCHYKLARYRNAVSFGERYIKEFYKSKYYLNAVSLVGESYLSLREEYEATYYLTKFYVQTHDTTAKQKAFERIIELLPTLSMAELEKLHRLFMADDIDEHFLYHLAQAEAQRGRKEDAERD